MCNDLMQVYREVVADCPMGTTQTEVYEQVVRHPAPRFYIDARMAHLVISKMMRGDYSRLQQLKHLAARLILR